MHKIDPLNSFYYYRDRISTQSVLFSTRHFGQRFSNIPSSNSVLGFTVLPVRFVSSDTYLKGEILISNFAFLFRTIRRFSVILFVSVHIRHAAYVTTPHGLGKDEYSTRTVRCTTPRRYVLPNLTRPNRT